MIPYNKQLIKHKTSIFSFIVLGLGISIRLFQYLCNRSLWFDEVVLSSNIFSRNCWDLFFPLNNNQGAPIFFLVTEKFSTIVFGNNEYALRLMPLIVSVLGIFVFYEIIKILFKKRHQIILLALYCFSFWLVYYSHEVKQYAYDVTASLLVLYLFLIFQPHKTLDFRRSLYLGFVGGLLLWFSHAVMFILSGYGIIIFFNSFLKKEKKYLLGSLLINLIWFISFLLLFYISFSKLQQNELFYRYWDKAFFSLKINFNHIKKNILLFNRFFIYSGFSRFHFIFLIPLFFAGLLSFFKQNKFIAGYMASPFLMTIIASSLGKYPFWERLILFLTPLFYILIVKGLEFVEDKYLGLAFINKPSKKLSENHIINLENNVKFNKLKTYLYIFLVFCLVFSFLKNFNKIIFPIKREEIKFALFDLNKSLLKDDVIYVHNTAKHQIMFYKKILKKNMNYLFGVNGQLDKKGFIRDINKINEKKRIWVVFSNTSENEKESLLKLLKGKVLKHISKKNVDIYLFENNFTNQSLK